MRVHVLGGFLGAGKTTAAVALTRFLRWLDVSFRLRFFLPSGEPGASASCTVAVSLLPPPPLPLLLRRRFV